jgi:hypothetical protein
MGFVKAHKLQFLAGGPLAIAVTALTLTACGGGGSTSVTQGSAPGQWTQSEVSQFLASAGSDGSSSEDTCIEGYFEKDMSFGYAEAVGSVAGVSSNMSVSQIDSAIINKYGSTEGTAINAQFAQVVSDSVSNCSGD